MRSLPLPLLLLISCICQAKMPHIVLLALDEYLLPPTVLACISDDCGGCSIGWADVGYHGSNFPTPNIDALAATGVKLERMYAMPQCSPTRAALLTGRYSFRTGMQHYTTIFPGATAGIPLDTPTIAELFAGAGYNTAMVGKWHLGYSSWAQTPTGRGFDSYLGYLQGQTDYYNRTMASCGRGNCLYKHNDKPGMPAGGDSPTGNAYDFWRDSSPAFDQFGEYTSDSYNGRIDELIDTHKNSSAKPLFLYYAEQQLHIPLQAPPQPEHLEACSNITGGSTTVNRTILCSMASKLDESVGRLVDSLQRADMWKDTMMFVISDNGGMTHWGDAFPASASSNWPLRGGKATLFEGGVRSVSFLAGGALPSERPSHYDGLLHVSDILPTLASQAGVTLPKEIDFDGINAWQHIFGGNAAERRTEIPLNIDTNGGLSMVPHLLPRPGDDNANFSALIQEINGTRFKFIVGATCNPGLPGAAQMMDGWWTIDPYKRILPSQENWASDSLLFDLDNDEGEHKNVAAVYPHVVAAMSARVQDYWASTKHGWVRAQTNIPMPLANPKLHNWTWAPFRPSLHRSKYRNRLLELETQSEYVEE